ncbi:MAG: ABC transporter ATP-binding protein [Actinomycetota bacterium]|jgi:ABC-2 type transport system ATP-binding protein|nr:ABC transporter ATP-binding protein [Actinomycetota bacterium]
MEDEVIRIDKLVKRFRHGVVAVDNLDLNVLPGQVLGLAGPNGSGKSVTIRSMLGLLRPTSGTVELFGQRMRPGARVLSRVGALVDGPGFVPDLSGADNLLLAARTSGRNVTAEHLDEAIDLASLGSALDRPYATYSHGMRYRLGLARALLSWPELLLLDEAATGLDPLQASEVRRRVSNTASEHGTTVVYACHQLSEVEEICTHVAVMRAGRLVVSGPIDDVLGKGNTLQVDTPDPPAAMSAMRTFPGVASMRVVDHSLIVALSPTSDLHRSHGIGSAIGVEGAEQRDLSEMMRRLEDAHVLVNSVRRGLNLDLVYEQLVGGTRIAAERDCVSEPIPAAEETPVHATVTQ